MENITMQKQLNGKSPATIFEGLETCRYARNILLIIFRRMQNMALEARICGGIEPDYALQFRNVTNLKLHTNDVWV